MKKNPTKKQESPKDAQLLEHSENPENQMLTTDQGLKINDNQNSLKAGERGATLLEDFILREKITHFDHERIPERIVHARGAAAHGYFELYESIGQYTKAGFLNDTSRRTPVFARFSTVAGSRGSSDLARDVRGFSVKFYTEEGNYDFVGNNMPVFFIQDAIKFPDLIHAVKPEPHNEIPQAVSAHDTFWDFISLMPESAHMIMWIMSDRAIPRSLRMMEGFGVHTFRFINEKGKSSFVKFHWKPKLGVHSVAWDEAQIISGKDPDFHRRDLWENIEAGNFPEWELGIQIVSDKDEFKYDFDLLDPTKLIPEELVPVQIIGKMTLNRNPDNYFAETEQVAFHPGHLVPGIDFTNDPLLQGRLFSYTDTQLSRLGSPNFHEIPINRSINQVHNNQRDGHMRQQINQAKTSYEPNTLSGGCPFQASMADGGFTSFMERIDAQKIRNRSKSFFDHFSQATLFYNSQSPAEKNHLADALKFELGKVEHTDIRERMVTILMNVDEALAKDVAAAVGVAVPKAMPKILNHGVPADIDPKTYQPIKAKQAIDRSEALSMANTVKDTIKTRQVAILATHGVNGADLKAMKKSLEQNGAKVQVIAPALGDIKTAEGEAVHVDQRLAAACSVLFDSTYVPGGAKSIAVLKENLNVIQFIDETLKHFKPFGYNEEATALIQNTFLGKKLIGEKKAKELAKDGIIVTTGAAKGSQDYVNAIAQHRFWTRGNATK